MSYTGTKVEIPLGKFGVHTDDANADLKLGELFRAVNVDFYEGILQKAPGAKKWNQFPLDSSIVGAYDWYPVEGVRKLTAACADGSIYQFNHAYQAPYKIMPEAGAPSVLKMGNQPYFVTGGLDNASENRKLFFFSGNDMPQVIDGQATTRRNFTKPAVEWTNGNYPSAGIVFRSMLFTWGYKDDPHLYIASNQGDMENFETRTDIGSTLNAGRVFPGEGEILTSAITFHGKLFLFKYPSGAYVLNDTDIDTKNWYFEKLNTSLGAASSHGITELIDDIAVGNQFGTVSMMSAAFQLGQTKFADLMANMRVEQMVRSETRQMLRNARWSIFYPDKKLALFTYQSTIGTLTDRFVCVDFTNSLPKAYLIDSRTPLCLFLYKNNKGVQTPAYGSSDGYVYVMDTPNRLVGGSDYDFEFRIPYIDVGAQAHKIFDALEVECEHSGLWDLYCDVHIDDYFSETLRFSMSNPSVLRGTADAQCFQLDRDRLLGRQTKSVRRALHGRGRRAAFRFYATHESGPSAGKNFRLTKLVLYARLGNEDKTTR